jgi:subtilisin family serine protease
LAGVNGGTPLGRLLFALALATLAAASPASGRSPAGEHAAQEEPVQEAALASIAAGTAANTGLAPGVTLAPPPAQPLVSNGLLVRFRRGTSAARERRLRGSLGANLARSYKLVPGLQLLRTGRRRAARRALDAAAAISRDPSVLYAIPNYAYHVQVVPNDPLYKQQWGMPSIGAPAAWSRSTGSPSVIVAVLDTGIVLDHPDLEANVWTNPHPGEGGFAGDVHGWDFVGGDDDPSDDNGHGTHVAGILGAVGNDKLGVAGVDWSVGLMPLKICDSEGNCSLGDEIAALEYAVAHGAKVVNASFAGPYGGYQPEQEAIRAAGQAGLLFVAAAGNDAANNDVIPHYPASYPLENVISVAATSSAGALAGFSDYGLNTVGMGAPGEKILSTLPTSGKLSSSTGYGELSGSSMAAPQVAGAAALLWSLHPAWTMQQIRDRLLSTTRPLASLAGKVSTCGQLSLDTASDPAVGERASLCVAPRGTGAGSVSSSPAGIACDSACTASFAPATPVTLTATPAEGSTFAEWRGACTGTGPCTVAPGAALAVSPVLRASAMGAPWRDAPLAAPSEHAPITPGEDVDGSFFDVSLSAAGDVRAKTLYQQPSGTCSYASSDTGGVYLERKTPSGWVADGSLTAPTLGEDTGARWANCSYFGSVTELSGDGSTLLVDPVTASTSNPELGLRHRCAAFVYRRGAGGWQLDGTLFPPGVGPEGSSEAKPCEFFGIGGAISADGDQVAVRRAGRIDTYLREAEGWSLQQDIPLPTDPECGKRVGPREIALSGEGATLLVGDLSCRTNSVNNSGRVYVYERTGGGWSLAQTIASPEAQTQNGFGSSIAISADGDTAAINVTQRVTGLPENAGAAWIFQRVEGGWQPEVRLAGPSSEAAGFACPEILEEGTRIVCGASDKVGFDALQGSIYVFERPGPSWSSAPAPARLFALEGASADRLGLIGHYKWRAFAAAADGSEIDATISPGNLANGAYPADRIGYEFSPMPQPPQPEFGRCAPASTGGEYANAVCTRRRTGGDYGWSPGVAKAGFTTALASEVATLQTVGGAKVSCHGETGGGEYTSATTVGATVLAFTDCEGFGSACASAGAAAGEVLTSTLAGTLGVQTIASTPTKNKVALVLRPAGGSGAVTTLTCGARQLSVRGAVIVPIAANKMLEAQTLSFAATKGKQKPESLAQLPREVLEASLDAGAYEQAGLKAKLLVKSEEAVEVNST